jgi:hypothetical protein
MGRDAEPLAAVTTPPLPMQQLPPPRARRAPFPTPLAAAALLALAAAAALSPAAAWVKWSDVPVGPGPRAGHSLLLFNETL